MVRIGVTGHRVFDDVDDVERRVDRVLDEVCGRHGGSDIEVWSSLAEGADRLVAELLVRRGAELVVVLPVPAGDYRTDFADPLSVAEFDRLVASAQEVHLARPADATREAAYEAAGHVLLDHVAVLVALWDGAASRGRGGTAEVVAEARRRGIEVVVVPVTRANV